MGTLLAHLKARHSWLLELVVIMVGTGCRLGEALRLDWSNVDAARGQLVIKRRKTADALTLETTGPLKDALWNLWMAGGMPTGGLVFPDSNGALRDRYRVREALKDEGRKVSLGWITPRVFRRMAAEAAANHSGILAASRLLGHSTVTMTQNYLGRGEEARGQGLKATGALLSEALGTNCGLKSDGPDVAKDTAERKG